MKQRGIWPLTVSVSVILAGLACNTLAAPSPDAATPRPATAVGDATPRVSTTAPTATRPAATATRAAGPTATRAAPTATRPAATATRAAPTRTAGPTATLAQIEGVSGPYQVRGDFAVTNGFVLDTYMVEHAVALTDLHGFVLRDPEWPLSVDSQTIGFMQVSGLTGTYDLNLPLRPEGVFNDVDNNGAADAGVQIFAVAYSPNVAGGPFSEGDDASYGWPSYLTSIRTDPENDDEVTGGRLVVWAPDSDQQFPTGFGADGRLFTADDPVGPLPAGYTIVDLDAAPFAQVREATPQLRLYEPADIAVKDFSDQSYTAAFESLYRLVSVEWAFNGLPDKQVDWAALYARLQPRVAQAEREADPEAFYRAIEAFAQAIPDGHVGVGGSDLAEQIYVDTARSGYGVALRELDDGRFVAVYIAPGSAAEDAGMEVGAEITEFDGRPIAEAVSRVEPLEGPFSQALFKRYQQTRYLMRAPVGARVAVSYLNPGAAAPRTATLIATREFDSFFATSFYENYTAPELPVTYRQLESGIGYIEIASYYDDLNLIIRLFERALRSFSAEDVDKLIIDLRFNSGGNPLGLPGFLTSEEIVLGQDEAYSAATGRFEREGVPDRLLPAATVYRFSNLAVLVGPACYSACEKEAYAFSLLPGAEVVGFYPSAGVYANVAGGQVDLPDGLSFQFSTERTVKPDGAVLLEGVGVLPTRRVPLTLENVLATEDVVLQTAEAWLLEQ